MRDERFESHDHRPQHHGRQFKEPVRPLRDLHDDLDDLPHREKFASADLIRMIDRRFIIQRPEQHRDQVFHPQRLDDRPRAARQWKKERRHLQQASQAGGEMVFRAEDERGLKDCVRHARPPDMFFGDALGLEDRVSPMSGWRRYG